MRCPHQHLRLGLGEDMLRNAQHVPRLACSFEPCGATRERSACNRAREHGCLSHHHVLTRLASIHVGSHTAVTRCRTSKHAALIRSAHCSHDKEGMSSGWSGSRASLEFEVGVDCQYEGQQPRWQHKATGCTARRCKGHAFCLDGKGQAKERPLNPHREDAPVGALFQGGDCLHDLS